MHRLVFVVVLLGAAFAVDKEFWLHKPYTNWSEDECQEMLHDSPWAKTRTSHQSTMRPISRGTDRAGVADPALPSGRPQAVYTAQIRSARPLREAYVRLKQIETHFDSLTGSKRATVQEAYERYLSEKFEDKIVVVVEYDHGSLDLDDYWRRQTLSTLKGRVFLSGPDGDRIEPIAYVAGTEAENDFEFVFPRDTAAAHANLHKPLAFEFKHPSVPFPLRQFDNFQPPIEEEERMFFRFAPREMTINGKVVY